MRTLEPGFDVRRRRGLVPALFCGAILAVCAGARAEENAAAVAASTATAVDPNSPTAQADQPYVFNGVTRDPFLPLVGGAAADMGPSTPDKEPGAFNPASVELKGIIRTGTGRWATLATSSGDRYIVQNGKIHDAKKKPVEGYVGIIKEKTLVIIGPNNQVTELKMKRDQDEKNKLK